MAFFIVFHDLTCFRKVVWFWGPFLVTTSVVPHCSFLQFVFFLTFLVFFLTCFHSPPLLIPVKLNRTQTHATWTASPSSWTGRWGRSSDGSDAAGTRTSPARTQSSARACECFYAQCCSPLTSQGTWFVGSLVLLGRLGSGEELREFHLQGCLNKCRLSFSCLHRLLHLEPHCQFFPH